MNNSKQPAFTKDNVHGGHFGLTKREYFAAQFLSNAIDHKIEFNHNFDKTTVKIMVQKSIQLADELLNQLENEQPETT